MNPFRSLPFALLLGLAAVLPIRAAQPTEFHFRMPQDRAFVVQGDRFAAAAEWLQASPETAPDDVYLIGSKIAVKLAPGKRIEPLIAGTSLIIQEKVAEDLYLLQALTAWNAATEAQRLTSLPEVLASSPVMREPLSAQSGYSYKPNDPLFSSQWHLENRNSNGISAGVDLNVRAAWPVTHGEGVIVGIADYAVELTHPDLASRGAGSYHYNFLNNTTNLSLGTSGSQDAHATPIAGLAVGELNNNLGISGVAPGAQFASWRVFNTNDAATSDDEFRQMFQYASNSVAVQNHSWLYSGTALPHSPSFLQTQGVDNAINQGRGGRGVIMVHAVGNYRLNDPNGFSFAGNANDYGEANNPRVIAVGSVRSDGRVAHYSNPGACILVSAPSSESGTVDTTVIDTNYPTLTTADRVGALGYNSSDYMTGTSGFSQNSASVPQIAGLCALMLSANTNLTYRDVQQILILSSRHYDFADPSVETNAAGLIVSHNVGFGVPDAGLAVKLAKSWVNRSAMTNITFTSSISNAIPDATNAYVVRATGANVPTNLFTVYGFMPFESQHPDITPGEMLRPDSPTASLPVVYLGQALTNVTQDLTNKAALILRGGDTFYNKIIRAQSAGASFVIMVNTSDLLERMTFAGFPKIPSIQIPNVIGSALTNQAVTNANLRVQLQLNPAAYTFSVTNQLLCEYVGVRIQSTHQRREDLRITLTSPAGTRSILQRYNSGAVTNSGPTDYTYWTTHNFYESSVGTWTVQITDEQTNNTGGIILCGLSINGVPIVDSDHDGLDDNWEIANFGSISAYGPKDDPDKDGYSNIREFVMGTNPNQPNDALQLDFSPWDNKLARVSWPSSANYTYTVGYGSNVAGLNLTTNFVGQFPQTEWFVPYTNGNQFFKVSHP